MTTELAIYDDGEDWITQLTRPTPKPVCRLDCDELCDECKDCGSLWI